MRTRTLRWITILISAAIPLITLGYFVSHDPATPHIPSITGPFACRAAQHLEHVDHATGTARLKKLAELDDAATADAATQKRNARTRVCAAAALRRTAPVATVFDRLYDATQSGVNDLLGLVGGPEVRLAETPSTTTVTGLLALQLALLLLAIRTFFVWRGEREPGPVEVKSISGPADAKDTTVLAEIVRETLARAGVAPGTSSAGEVGAVVVDTLESVPGSAGWLAQAATALAAAMNPVMGFTVTGTAFHDDAAGECAISVVVSVTRSKAPFKVLRVVGPTYADAAENAAYAIYELLANRASVASRTPRWLAWTTQGGLRAYDRGTRRHEDGDLRGAHSDLVAAAHDEPSNLLVGLRLSAVESALAHGQPDERVLRGVPAGAWADPQAAIRGLATALRYAALSPGSDEALQEAAIRLSFVETWIAAWPLLDAETRDEVARLTELAVRQRSWFFRTWNMPAPTEPLAAFEARFRDAAVVLLRRLVAHQRYSSVIVRSWRLATRRERADRLAPWSRVRFNWRHSALAILEGTQCDQLRRDRSARWPRYVVVFLRSGLRCSRVSIGCRLRRDPIHAVEWNLALAYACRARVMRSIAPGSSAWSEPMQRAVLRSLDRSLLAVGGRLGRPDLVLVADAPDLADPAAPARLAPYVAEWARPLGLPEQASADCVWDGEADRVRAAAKAVGAAWEEWLVSVRSSGPMALLQRAHHLEPEARDAFLARADAEAALGTATRGYCGRAYDASGWELVRSAAARLDAKGLSERASVAAGPAEPGGATRFQSVRAACEAAAAASAAAATALHTDARDGNGITVGEREQYVRSAVARWQAVAHA